MSVETTATNAATTAATTETMANETDAATETSSASETHSQTDSERLRNRYRQVRRFSEQLAAPLSAEDCAVQSMENASPTKWHLAHTTWFFETFLLSGLPGYRKFNDQFTQLYNSYYNSVGEQFPRSKRGFLSRPSLDETLDYRTYVDGAMELLIADEQFLHSDSVHVLETGLQHEQQHQELLLTDIKHALSQNPLMPTYREGEFAVSDHQSETTWMGFDEQLFQRGSEGDGFCFDNELPKHRVFHEPYQVADRLVTCGEYMQFMDDGAYSRPELWLSMGWSTVQEQDWQSPLYWTKVDGQWHEFTLGGLRPVDPAQPVCHVSYFEADAFARWSQARLPTESEWERAAESASLSDGVFVDTLISSDSAIHPRSTSNTTQTMFGNVWQWTASQYTAYPGYVAPDGALGEYNGKFMCNQFVLRGGSCATHSSHIRSTYRNFFSPDARWQFTGIRLAK